MSTPPRAAGTVGGTGGYFSTMPAVKAFRRQHPDWRMLQFQDGPLYTLPAEAIDVLARVAGPGRPALSSADAVHEVAFAKFCDIRNALGVWTWGFVYRN